VLAESTLEQSDRSLDNLLQDHGLWVERLSSSKGQELRVQLCSALSCFKGHASHVLLRRIAHALREQLCIADDDGEQVVEVVGNPPSELADSLHLLRLPKLLFEL
jgi:hypothetical protein